MFAKMFSTGRPHTCTHNMRTRTHTINVYFTPKFTHTHTRTHAHTHTHTHTHTTMFIFRPKSTHIHTQAHTCPRIKIHITIPTVTLIHNLVHAHMHTHTCPPIPTLGHTYTHTHTHTHFQFNIDIHNYLSSHANQPVIPMPITCTRLVSVLTSAQTHSCLNVTVIQLSFDK